ncbi:hypothetical protein GQ54DRAFT_81358 [Martensiomyces pterosporus]|nr:hypothetical protein GQ54DRAFT_81358 [Martensiomyces pterosporus]
MTVNKPGTLATYRLSLVISVVCIDGSSPSIVLLLFPILASLVPIPDFVRCSQFFRPSLLFVSLPCRLAALPPCRLPTGQASSEGVVTHIPANSAAPCIY